MASRGQRSFPERNRPLTSVALLAILLLALALRLAPWGHNRFLEDEALYGYWGLQIATGADPMLNAEPVDKPPLYPYLLALSFQLLGQNETAARLPGLWASMTGIALVYALGKRLYADRWVGLLAALLLALSPFDILFASTAFTDPLLTMWVLAALLAAARGRPDLAGLLSGLAMATKQQGLFFLPLVVFVGARPGAKPRRSAWLRFALGLALIMATALGWDLARTQRPGFWQQSLVSYGGLGLARPQTLGERAGGWLRLVGLFWASPWFNVSLAGALLLRLAGPWRPGRPLSQVDWALLIFAIGFLALHWLVDFQVWDRYLLPLVPLVAILAGCALVTPGRAIQVRRQRAYAVTLPLLLAALLVGPAGRAVRSELPVGGDHGAYDGIDQLAAYLRAEAPPGAVLYHHWLGYHYRFYLYGAPLRLHWYPDPEDLAHDATVYRREPRYIAFPSFQDSAPMQAALTAARIDLVPVLTTHRRDGTASFRLYRLQGP